jgi:hypothetical protein
MAKLFVASVTLNVMLIYVLWRVEHTMGFFRLLFRVWRDN